MNTDILNQSSTTLDMLSNWTLIGLWFTKNETTLNNWKKMFTSHIFMLHEYGFGQVQLIGLF